MDNHGKSFIEKAFFGLFATIALLLPLTLCVTGVALYVKANKSYHDGIEAEERQKVREAEKVEEMSRRARAADTGGEF